MIAGLCREDLQMMTSIFKVKIKDDFQTFSRNNGAEARKELLSHIESHDFIEIDFEDSIITPSFADECIGQIAKILGKDKFKSKFKFKNIPPDVKSLLLQVISRRLSTK